MDKTTTASTSTGLAGDPESYWFSSQWLRGSRHLAVRSAPVIAVVQELATILRDEQTPAPQALLALRRAVRLLAVLAGGTRDENPRSEDYRRTIDIDPAARDPGPRRPAQARRRTPGLSLRAAADLHCWPVARAVRQISA